jgi:nucleoid-associated protein YgaU
MSKESERDDTSQVKPGGSSRLGKEAKIGVTVIAVLLIVFGAVVAVRLSGSSSDGNLAAAPDRDGGREKAHHEVKTEAILKDHPPRFSGSGAPPTMVPAKTASAGLPKTAAGDLDQWKLASDRGSAKRIGGNTPLNAPPSLMPDPPKPPRADPPKPPYADLHAPVVLDPPPLRREPSRYDNPSRSAWRDGSSYSAGAERSTPAAPVGQYAAGDYRRELAGPRHNSGELRRSAAASLPPPRRDDGKYEVQPNDSYWTISERLYGTGAYFKALAQLNRGNGAGEDWLQPGTLISAPTVTELEKSYPDLCPKPSRRDAMQSQTQSRVSTVSTRHQHRGGRTYTVVEGDTLFNIARYELGKASRWAEIYDLNRDVLGKDFNYLTPGTQLVMPEGEKSDVIAQPPSNVYRR